MANNGYGSILLNTLIDIAKSRNVSVISGWISRVDYNHIERILHFYQKHGFDVIQKEYNTYKIGNLIWINE